MVDPTTPQTVWILGAGFSRALGAPLFRDLFRSSHRVKAACGGTPPEGMIGVLAHYRRHAPAEVGGSGAEHGVFWRDPEEFIDMIESAGRGPGPAGDLLKTDGDSIKTETLVDMGRRALAIECSHFLRNANLDAERWLPYRIWGGQLDQQHTILTFNYDRIPELLESAKTTNRLPGAKLTVIDPERLDEGHVGMVQRMGSAPVLKLHGSVDWIVSNGRIKIDLADDLPTSCSKGTDLVLAVPGPAKASLRDEHKGIGRLWNAAKKAIRTANRIIFVGYRFPPTDAEARFELLGAVEDAREGSHLKKVQVVLGPNEHDPDVARMKKLLGFVSPGIVEVIPLLAEDFLALPAAYR